MCSGPENAGNGEIVKLGSILKQKSIAAMNFSSDDYQTGTELIHKTQELSTKEYHEEEIETDFTLSTTKMYKNIDEYQMGKPLATITLFQMEHEMFKCPIHVRIQERPLEIQTRLSLPWTYGIKCITGEQNRCEI